MDLSKKIIYIAGPMTGVANHNKPLFTEVQAFLERTYDAVVLNPALLPDGMTHRAYMNICLPMLREADAVVLLPKWHASKGAMMEFQEAMMRCIPVFELQGAA